MMEVLSIADWRFRVDIAATQEHTLRNSLDHCLCPYCRNFYENLDFAQPRLRQVLAKFGVLAEGPSEVMPLEHNVILACYRVTGSIQNMGKLRLYVDDVQLFPEPSDEGSFLLWVGAMELPWTQEEAPEDVISPANQPEFLDRMAAKWLELTEADTIYS